MKLNLRPRTQPEVNLTSLIDVVLLLLIFFMVSTSFVKQSQITISLPEADSSAIVEEVPEQIDIMITETGGFLVNGRELINTRVETIRNALQKVSGGDNTLQRGTTAGKGPNPFLNVHAAGYRGVYDFADPDSSVFITATGQSGHPLSRHYDDLGELWRRGEYIQMTLDPDLARAGAVGITRLNPIE